MASNIIKWVSLPVLLIGAVFSQSAASYELLMDCLICTGAIIVVQRAVWAREYAWAGGFVAIAAVFSPLLLVDKIFFMMGLTCIATFAAVLAAWKLQPLPLVAAQ